MSQITRAILSFSALENDPERLHEVNWVLIRHGAGGVFQDVGEHVEGRKAFGSLYAAVFNGFGSTKLRTALQEVAWQYPKEVQFLAQEEDNASYRSYVLENWVEPPEQRVERLERELADIRQRLREVCGLEG